MAIKKIKAAPKKVRQAFQLPNGDTFTCRLAIPYRKWTDLFDPEAALTVDDLFRAALIPEDAERFLALLDDDEADEEAVVTVAMVNELANWLIEYYSGNVQGQPSS